MIRKANSTILLISLISKTNFHIVTSMCSRKNGRKAAQRLSDEVLMNTRRIG